MSQNVKLIFKIAVYFKGLKVKLEAGFKYKVHFSLIGGELTHLGAMKY